LLAQILDSLATIVARRIGDDVIHSDFFDKDVLFLDKFNMSLEVVAVILRLLFMRKELY